MIKIQEDAFYYNRKIIQMKKKLLSVKKGNVFNINNINEEEMNNIINKNDDDGIFDEESYFIDLLTIILDNYIIFPIYKHIKCF